MKYFVHIFSTGDHQQRSSKGIKEGSPKEDRQMSRYCLIFTLIFNVQALDVIKD